VRSVSRASRSAWIGACLVSRALRAGREHEWLFSSPEGQPDLLKVPSSAMLVSCVRSIKLTSGLVCSKRATLVWCSCA
jgi:hypothetical protein